MRSKTTLAMLLLCLLLRSAPAYPQRRRPVPELPPDSPDIKMQREQAKRLNLERQAALKRDTDKLLRLTTELKRYVDNSNENTLSLDVIKKAEEIEKLARSVKEKMKGTY